MPRQSRAVFVRHVTPRKPVMAAYREIFRDGKVNNVHKFMLLSQNYEKPTWYRVRMRIETKYYARWHFIKYCTQVARYALRHNLRFGKPLSREDEMRPLLTTPSGVPSLEDAHKRKRFLDDKRDELLGEISAMDTEVDATSEAVRQMSADDILRVMQRRRGILPAKSKFIDTYAGQGWGKDEAEMLYVKLCRLRKIEVLGHAWQKAIRRLAERQGREEAIANPVMRARTAYTADELGRMYDSHHAGEEYVRVSVPSL